MVVSVVNKSNNPLPKFETADSAGMDVRADFSRVTPENPIKLYGQGETIYKDNKMILKLAPGSRALIPTGLFTAIPSGYYLAVHPRSGLSLKKALTCCNAVGVIDADYRNEIGVIIINLGQTEAEIEDGERIAQLILTPYEWFIWNQVDNLNKTERNGGFGSTGSI